MLYDPKWEVETKADPFSLESLIAWLEKQPVNKKYNWHSCDDCLAAQWLKAVTGHARHIFSEVVPYYAFIAGYEPYTFGAALERARKMQNQPPV